MINFDDPVLDGGTLAGIGIVGKKQRSRKEQKQAELFKEQLAYLQKAGLSTKFIDNYIDLYNAKGWSGAQYWLMDEVDKLNEERTIGDIRSSVARKRRKMFKVPVDIAKEVGEGAWEGVKEVGKGVGNTFMEFGKALLGGESGPTASALYAAGYIYNPKTREFEQTEENIEKTKGLRNNLAALGAGSLAAMTIPAVTAAGGTTAVTGAGTGAGAGASAPVAVNGIGIGTIGVNTSAGVIPMTVEIPATYTLGLGATAAAAGSYSSSLSGNYGDYVPEWAPEGSYTGGSYSGGYSGGSSYSGGSYTGGNTPTPPKPPKPKSEFGKKLLEFTKKVGKKTYDVGKSVGKTGWNAGKEVVTGTWNHAVKPLLPYAMVGGLGYLYFTDQLDKNVKKEEEKKQQEATTKAAVENASNLQFDGEITEQGLINNDSAVHESFMLKFNELNGGLNR